MSVEGIQGLQPLRNIFNIQSIENFKEKGAQPAAVSFEAHKPIGFSNKNGQSSALPTGALGENAVYANNARLGAKLNFFA